MSRYVAIDEKGSTYRINHENPRQWLCRHFGRKHADRLVRDGRHIGYRIARHDIEVFKLVPFENGE